MNYPNTITFTMADKIEQHYYRKNFPRYYGIQYCYNGRLNLKINNSTYELHGSWVFITYPGNNYEYELSGDKTFLFRYLCMAPDSVKPYVECGLLPLVSCPIEIHAASKFSQSFDEAIELINSNIPENLYRATWRVQDLMLQLHEQKRHNSKIDREKEKQFTILIDNLCNHPESPWDFVEEAQRLQMSIRHFRRVFHLFCGIAPNQFLTQCRLNRAVALLLKTNAQIKQIADQIGIPDEYYFSNLFKKKFHLSPRAYREEFKSQSR